MLIVTIVDTRKGDRVRLSPPPAIRSLRSHTKAQFAKRSLTCSLSPTTKAQARPSVRIETARPPFPRVFFNKDITEEAAKRLAGITKRSRTTPSAISGSGRTMIEARIADAFGLMCIHYDQPDGAPPPAERYRGRRSSGGGGGSWQSV